MSENLNRGGTKLSLEIIYVAKPGSKLFLERAPRDELWLLAWYPGLVVEFPVIAPGVSGARRGFGFMVLCPVILFFDFL